MNPDKNQMEKKFHPKDRRRLPGDRNQSRNDQEVPEALVAGPSWAMDRLRLEPKPMGVDEENSNYPVVETSNGKVRGSIRNDIDVRAYENKRMKYAGFYKIPVVETYRFKEPGNIIKWTGIWDLSKATKEAYFEGSCVAYVNVYTKKLPGYEFDEIIEEKEEASKESQGGKKKNKNEKHAVMVFVPGESSVNDDAEISFYGPEFLLREDVVLVVISYRTGILGNLKCEHDYNGNQGVSDVKACLKWVANEIEAFGGDPNNITCFGQGEGAAALWTLSKKAFWDVDRKRKANEEQKKVKNQRAGAEKYQGKKKGKKPGNHQKEDEGTSQGQDQGKKKGKKPVKNQEEDEEMTEGKNVPVTEKQLYHKLILQSSTGQCRQWVNKMTAEEFCCFTGIDGGGKCLETLEKMNYKTLRDHEKKLPKKALYRMIDYGELLCLDENVFEYKVPVMIGFNSNEYFYDKTNYNDIDGNKGSILDTLGHHHPTDQMDSEFYVNLRRDDLVNQIRAKFYDNKPTPTQEKFEQVTQDLRHTISVLNQAKLLAIGMNHGGKRNKIFLYKFAANTHLNLYKSHMKRKINVPGATYGDELGYLFKAPKIIPFAPGSKEEMLRNGMVTLWTNFAKMGEPLPGNEAKKYAKKEEPNLGPNYLMGSDNWKGLRMAEAKVKTKVRELRLRSMMGVTIGDDKMKYEEMPEIQRMKEWWKILLEGDDWFEE